MRGLNWGLLQVPLAAGLNQKGDTRAGNPPTLDICTDAQFDEIGGLQTRYPFSAIGNSILGGGTLSNARRLAVNGDELLCFTKDTLYSWSPQLSKWISKGTHLAVKLREETAFATTGDQTQPDRAELNGTVVYAWLDNGIAYVAARDKTTGALLTGPTTISGTRPRLVALSTKILLFNDVTGTGLSVRAIDPADPATGIASAATLILATASYDAYYDVTRVIGADQAIGVARRNPNTSYEVFTVTSGLTVAQSTKARTSTEPMAVSCAPTGTHAQILRGDSGSANVIGDYVAIGGFADVYTGQAVGTFTSAIQQIAAAHRSVQDSGQYRCYAFWSSSESMGAVYSAFATKSNWVDTGNSLGTQAVFVRQGSVASRAFDYDGRVFVWLAFGNSSGFTGSGAGSLRIANVQNGYFLFRDDAFLCAKAVYHRGGGITGGGNGTVGLLPGVALTSGSTVFSWCTAERRRIDVGPGTSGGVSGVGETYAMRAAHDVTFTFDSNEARRCARLGGTLYIASGEILQYDGRRIVECGFHTAPWFFQALIGAAGNIANGTYAYQPTWRWHNARGEVDRSTTVVIGNVTMSGGPKNIDIDALYPLTFSHKGNEAALELWRTAVNPTPDSPFYLVTSVNPATAINPNRYLANDTNQTTLPAAPAFEDAYDDATLTTKETHPETGGILESVAPPAASLVIANESRVFLGNVSGDPDRIWYSKIRSDGTVAAFHEALTIPVPHAGGAITGMAFLNETLIVFRETAIYAFPGDGFGNDGSGQNFGPARALSTELGAVNAEGIAVIAQGLIFKSSKGWYVLNRGWGLDYVGAPVVDYDSEAPLAAHVLTSKHQVRLLTASRMLVWDYLVNQWGEWTISDGLDAVLWSDTHHYLTSTNVKAEQSTYSAVDYGMDIETAWVKLNDLQGYGRIRRMFMLGEYKSDHVVRVRIARDYQATSPGVWDYFDDQYWTVTPVTVGGPEQVKIGPSQQQCEAIKIRITIRRLSGGVYVAPNGEALKLTGLALEVGVKPQPYQNLSSGQKI